MDRKQLEKVVELNKNLQEVEKLEKFLIINPNFRVSVYRSAFDNDVSCRMPDKMSRSFIRLVSDMADKLRKEVESL